MKEKLLAVEHPDLVLSCNGKMYDELKGNRFYGLIDMDLNPQKPWIGNLNVPSVHSQARIISSPVAFIGQAFNTVSYTHEYAPALNVAACLFDNLTLHSMIREQGGAYGSGAVNNAMASHFYFYSYRDPNIVNSIKAFDKSIKNVLEGNFDSEDLSEAKLEIIQSSDAPISPGSRADLAYGWLREGKYPAIRQAFRDKILGLTKEQVIEAIRSEILPKREASAIIVFAGKELLEKENAKFAELHETPLTIEPI